MKTKFLFNLGCTRVNLHCIELGNVWFTCVQGRTEVHGISSIQHNIHTEDIALCPILHQKKSRRLPGLETPKEIQLIHYVCDPILEKER